MVIYQARLKQGLFHWPSPGKSCIVDVYHDNIAELKPRLLIKWSAVEIDVPVSAVNIGSLNSALTRSRRKAKAAKSALDVATAEKASLGKLASNDVAAIQEAGREHPTTIQNFKPSNPFADRKLPLAEIKFLE